MSPELDKLTVIANRLPVERANDGWELAPGGLVTALRPVLRDTGGIWVGWTGESGNAPEPFEASDLHLVPVRLSKGEIENYYEGFSNGTLWPLYHDGIRFPQFHRHWWHPYRRVNRRFAREAAGTAPQSGSVWVHDYHLSLLPEMLRALRPDLRIGFYLHIPFPPEELFAQLPWRKDVLRGMLGANSIGFQTDYDARNFRNAARRYLGASTRGSRVKVDERSTRAESFPISIDSSAFAELAATEDTGRLAESIWEQMGRRKIILGVDRLDYSKGIGVRLRALETLLDRDPDLAREVIFVQIAVPSRENVAGYPEMRHEIEHLAGRINGKHSRFGQQPVYYRYVGLPREELVAFYRAADVMLVTPLRDGMNLVAKEYVACRVDADGVLVLSEFAGAAQQLKRAVLVNPYDIDGTADAVAKALRMSPVEQRRRMRSMQRHVFNHDVYKWARDALNAIGGEA